MEAPEIRRNATPKEVLIACGGWYECPKDAYSRRLGPLVGFSKKYADHSVKRQYVGEHYADFAMIEEWAHIMRGHVVKPLLRALTSAVDITDKDLVICGVSEGGRALATVLAEWMHRRCIYPEKAELGIDVPGERAPTALRFGRHRVFPGDRVIVIEDVCNNFSNTEKLIAGIEAAGGEAAAIACFLNRSAVYGRHFYGDGILVPIISLWSEAMPQWRQDDEAVSSDVVAGNVVFDPKPRIGELQEVMRKHAA